MAEGKRGVGIEREREHSRRYRAAGRTTLRFKAWTMRCDTALATTMATPRCLLLGMISGRPLRRRRGGDSAEVSGKAKGSIEPARSPAVGQREEPGPVSAFIPSISCCRCRLAVIVTEMTGAVGHVLAISESRSGDDLISAGAGNQQEIVVPVSPLAFRLRAPAVRFDQMLDDREAETGAALLA